MALNVNVVTKHQNQEEESSEIIFLGSVSGYGKIDEKKV
jgi:hypothetical protein